MVEDDNVLINAYIVISYYELSGIRALPLVLHLNSMDHSSIDVLYANEKNPLNSSDVKRAVQRSEIYRKSVEQEALIRLY